MPTAAIIDSQSVKTTEKGGLVAMTLASGQRQLFWPLLLPHRNMLPKCSRPLIDAHGSDVPMVSLNHFTAFSRSIHQLSRHHSAPLSYSAL